MSPRLHNSNSYTTLHLVHHNSDNHTTFHLHHQNSNSYTTFHSAYHIFYKNTTFHSDDHMFTKLHTLFSLPQFLTKKYHISSRLTPPTQFQNFIHNTVIPHSNKKYNISPKLLHFNSSTTIYLDYHNYNNNTVANRGSQTIVAGWDRTRDLRITRKAS